MLYAAGQAPCSVNGNVWVIAQNFHAQGNGGVGDAGTNGTQADYTDGFAAQFRADKLLFALLHILGQGGAAFQALRPLHSVRYIAAAGHQRADDQLGHSVGVGTGAVEHHDALLGALVNGNVVGAGTCAGNGQQAFGQGNIMQVGAAHQNALCVVGLVIDLELVGRQLCQPNRRNGVHGFNGIHNGG